MKYLRRGRARYPVSFYRLRVGGPGTTAARVLEPARIAWSDYMWIFVPPLLQAPVEPRNHIGRLRRGFTS